MNRKLMFQVAGGFLALLILIGCTTPTPTLTLTINENVCTLDGPMTIPLGEFMIKLVIIAQKPTESGYALSTLQNGKTIEDLKAWPSYDQPPWLTVIDGVHEMAEGTHTYSYNFTKMENAAYHGESLYLVCARADPDTGIIAKLDSFGPIEIKK